MTHSPEGTENFFAASPSEGLGLIAHEGATLPMGEGFPQEVPAHETVSPTVLNGSSLPETVNTTEWRRDKPKPPEFGTQPPERVMQEAIAAAYGPPQPPRQ
jgi:hypothetical protein